MTRYEYETIRATSVPVDHKPQAFAVKDETLEQLSQIDKPIASRFNAGKPRLTLIPVDAQLEEAAVWAKGAEKYGDYNWEKLWGDNTVSLCMDCLLRHAVAIQLGEVYDAESGLQHAAHIRCNAAMLIRYFNSQTKTGVSSKT